MKKGLLITMMAVLIAGFGCASAPPPKDKSGEIRKNADKSYQGLEDEEDNPHDEGSRGGY
jgi:hypothetical protein